MTTPAPPHTDTAIDNFASYLARLAAREDGPGRAALAALRRSLGQEPGAIAETCRIVEPFLGEDARADRVAAFYLVGGLFGLHPVHAATDRNFGATLRSIRQREGTTEEDQGVERRFLALLDAPAENLGVHLRNLISLFHGKRPDAPVDYARLLRDILWWDHSDRFIQRNWANGFWGSHRADDTSGEASADAATTDNDDSTDD